MSKQNDQPVNRHDGFLSVAARLFWMVIGNAILFVSILLIYEHKGAMFHTVDAVFWSTVAAIILVRYLDIKFLGGLTATGTPASITHWRKHVILLLICSTAVWALSHGVNYMVVSR